MRAAVIGATGFIGRRLCEAHLDRGDDVSILARSPRAGDDLRLRGASVVAGGLRDEDALLQVCADADLVYNASGALGKWNTKSDEMEFVNATSAGRVVRCASIAGAGRVVHVGTAGVTGPLPDNVRAAEDHPCRPVTEYQKTKLAGEREAVKAHRDCGIPLTIVRPSFVYGPGDTHKLSLFRTVAAGRMVLVNGGRSRLHPVYVEDLVAGIMLAGVRALGEGEVYILAGDRPATTLEIVRAIASALSVAAPRLSLPEFALLPMARISEALGRAVGKEPPLTRSRVKLLSENYAYLIDKAGSEIGYRPTTDLVDGIRSTVDWYRCNGLVPSENRS